MKNKWLAVVVTNTVFVAYVCAMPQRPPDHPAPSALASMIFALPFGIGAVALLGLIRGKKMSCHKGALWTGGVVSVVSAVIASMLAWIYSQLFH